MVVKLLNRLSFESRILKLMNELEKVTYRYINTETKKIDSITFQNFQRFFIENGMTWTNKNNKFIYTIETPTERGRIEQVTTKNFSQKVDRENKFWLMHVGNVYRSINWVYFYYTIFVDHCVSLDNKTPDYFEQIRRGGFKQEKPMERKPVYTTYE